MRGKPTDFIFDGFGSEVNEPLEERMSGVFAVQVQLLKNTLQIFLGKLVAEVDNFQLAHFERRG